MKHEHFKTRMSILEMYSEELDRDVTPQTKTHIYHAVVKSSITYATKTWVSEAKTVTKLIPQKWTSGDAQLEFPKGQN